MKKRILCNLLALVLLLGLIPTAAYAGGSAQVIWSEDFGSSETWDSWIPVDANGDGYGFKVGYDIIYDEGGSCAGVADVVGSPLPLGEGSDFGMNSDDYLASPVIDLSDGFEEFELVFDVRMLQGEGAPPYTAANFYVIDADDPLTADGLKAMPYLRYDMIVPYPEDGWRHCRYDLTAYAGRKIRLVFHHIDDTANRIQFDNFQITEFESDSHIQRICVTNVPEPEVGLSVEDMKETDIKIHDTVNLELVPGSLEYTRTVHEQDETVTGAFEDGGEYDVIFQLRVKDGAFTYSDAVASVNGRKAFMTLDDRGTPGDSSDDIITIGYYYGYLHAPKTPVDRLDFLVSPPVAKQNPSFDVRIMQDSAEKVIVSWTLMKDWEIDGMSLYPADVFTGGQLYRVGIVVKPADGYCFSSTVECTVNGNPVTVHTSDPLGSILVSYIFVALDEGDCTVSFCTEYGQTPAPVTGTLGEWISLPVLPDQPDVRFGGWSRQIRAGDAEMLNGSIPLTGSCTLYAIWLEPIDVPKVGICTYGPDSDASHTTVVIDPYADYSAVEQVTYEPVLWWTDKSDVGRPGKRFQGRFEPGQTYYGELLLAADDGYFFPGDAEKDLEFSGAVLDEAAADGEHLRLRFHVTMPGDWTIQSAQICVPTRIPGYPVDGTTDIGVYSLTTGVNADPCTGLWEDPDDVTDYTKAYAGTQRPGHTYYGEFLLRPTGDASISSDIKLSIDGAKEVRRYPDAGYPELLHVVYAVDIMETYGFTAVCRSTNNTYPCGHIRADFHIYWETLFDFAFVPAGEHWIKALPEPGYAFVEWRTDDGTDRLISRDNPYSFTLDNNEWDICAVFAPVYSVTFMNSHGDAPAPQSVAEGGLVSEPKGLTANDYIFDGWFTDPACTTPYDFSEPVTGDLILYTGWHYSPGMNTDKTQLNQAIEDAGEIETGWYTDESVAAFQAALEAAKAVQSDPTVSQDTVDSALEDLNNAVFGLVLKSGGVDRTWLGLLIKDAETELKHRDLYTDASVAALENELESAKTVYAGALTQEAVDAAASKLDYALQTLQYKTGPFRFDDVKDESKFYYKPVYWAYEATPQITNGIDTTHFGPDRGCTRGQVVTFLWRAAGCPAPAKNETDFTDVAPGAFYGKAVAWAVENKITNGLSGDRFGPDATCTRGQIVTFLWRFKGEPEPGVTDTGFTDVDAGMYYAKGVAWAVENNVTNGMSADRFMPNLTCTRGQIVTFLYRAMGGT